MPSISASKLTTSVSLADVPRSVSCIFNSANISGVVNSRMSCTSALSQAACIRIKFVFALRKKAGVSKPAGIVCVCPLSQFNGAGAPDEWPKLEPISGVATRCAGSSA